MDVGATAAAAAGAGGSGGGGGVGSRIEEHRKYMSESSCCPRCVHKIDRKLDWVGLPAGVKFDPTDQELIEHLEAKVRSGGGSGGASGAAAVAHPLIDEFIPTIDGEDGICYTHPEKLPGVSKDGLSRHFFHRPSKAYTTGTRKRRKIQPPAAAAAVAPAGASGDGSGAGSSSSAAQQQQRSETRWHKTGKTRPVVVGGRQGGCKKILVLYTNFGKHRKPEKTNWVMHQYHLGEFEEEREGELVVSKIFYQTQPRQCGVGGDVAAGSSAVAAGGGAGAVATVERRRDRAAPSPLMGSSSSMLSAAFHAAAAIDDFSFTQFRNSFEEAGMGAASDLQVHARVDDGRVALHPAPAALHDGVLHQQQQQRQRQRKHGEHDHRRRHHYAGVGAAIHHQQEQQQRAAAAAVAAFQHVSTPTDPIATLIEASRVYQQAGTAVLMAPPSEPPPYDHAAPSYHHHHQQQQVAYSYVTGEDERPHQTRKFDGGRSTSGLEEVIMGCTSRRSNAAGETSGGKDDTQWQYQSPFWPSDSQDHHG